jgi:carboxyl-terminal processing protease
MIKKLKASAIVILLAALIAVYGTGCALIPTGLPNSEPGVDVIKEAWDIISREYVDSSKLNSANMTGAAISGMIETLEDPYTAYLTPQEFELTQSGISGHFDGIGAVVGMREGNLVIVSPFADSPAEKAGLKTGDIIKAINGESAEGMNVDIAVNKIRGPRGTPVTLTILHEGENEAVDITIIRNKIEISSVTMEMRGNIAIINILQFT